MNENNLITRKSPLSQTPSPKLTSSMEIDPSPPLQAISGEKDEWPDLPDTTRQPPSSPLQLDLDKTTIDQKNMKETHTQQHCQNQTSPQQPDTNQVRVFSEAQRSSLLSAYKNKQIKFANDVQATLKTD